MVTPVLSPCSGFWGQNPMLVTTVDNKDLLGKWEFAYHFAEILFQVWIYAISFLNSDAFITVNKKTKAQKASVTIINKPCPILIT